MQPSVFIVSWKQPSLTWCAHVSGRRKRWRRRAQRLRNRKSEKPSCGDVSTLAVACRMTSKVTRHWKVRTKYCGHVTFASRTIGS
jgi:hypothetical protein